MKGKYFLTIGYLMIIGISFASYANAWSPKTSTMYYVSGGDYKVRAFFLGYSEDYHWNFFTENDGKISLYVMNFTAYDNFFKTGDTSGGIHLAYSNESRGTITLSGKSNWYFVYINDNAFAIYLTIEMSVGYPSNSNDEESSNPATTIDKNPYPWVPFAVFGVIGFLAIVLSWVLIGFGRKRVNNKKERLKERERLAEIKEKRKKAKIQKLRAKHSEKKAETLQERRLREAEEAKKKNLLKKFASLKEQLKNERMISLESYAELAEKRLNPEELKNRKIALNNILEIHRYVKPIKFIRSPWGQISPKPSEIKELLKKTQTNQNLFKLIKIRFIE